MTTPKWGLALVLAGGLGLGACVSIPEGVLTAQSSVHTQIEALKTDSLAILGAYETAVLQDLVSDDALNGRYAVSVQAYEARCGVNNPPALCQEDRHLIIATLNAQILMGQQQRVEDAFDAQRQQLAGNFDATLSTHADITRYLRSAQAASLQREAFVSTLSDITHIDLTAIETAFDTAMDCLGGADMIASCTPGAN